MPNTNSSRYNTFLTNEYQLQNSPPPLLGIKIRKPKYHTQIYKYISTKLPDSMSIYAIKQLCNSLVSTKNY